jgi:hypothetical protein
MKTTFQKNARKSGFHPKNENHFSIMNRKIFQIIQEPSLKVNFHPINDVPYKPMLSKFL